MPPKSRPRKTASSFNRSPMKPTRLVTIAAALAAVSVLMWSQQQPAVPAPSQGGAGRGSRGGGGGFSQPDPIDFSDNTAWKPMFDGESLKGWDGNTQIWRVENGAIVTEAT